MIIIRAQRCSEREYYAVHQRFYRTRNRGDVWANIVCDWFSIGCGLWFLNIDIQREYDR